jgi:hypothetical protein
MRVELEREYVRKPTEAKAYAAGKACKFVLERDRFSSIRHPAPAF